MNGHFWLSLMAVGQLYFLSWLTVPFFSDSVVAYDNVTTVQIPVVLRVQTRGKLFPKGGERVTVHEKGNLLSKLLTGGDGVGYHTYISETRGLKNLTYTFGENTSESMVLVLGKDEPVIVIALDSVLVAERLFDETNKYAAKAITEISKDYHIVYVCGFMEKIIANRKWLKEKQLPLSVILPLSGVFTFQSLCDRNVNIHAAIGSASMLADASEFTKALFSFEKTSHGVQVQSWDEILKAIKKQDA